MNIYELVSHSCVSLLVKWCCTVRTAVGWLLCITVRSAIVFNYVREF